MFYDHPALKPYKWYWRVEPGVWFACAITYDPFLEMAKSGKKYGHAMALWEIGNTSATLFDHVSEYRKSKKLPSTDFWKSVVDASWVPWPFRPLMSRLATRDAAGDAWNLCHYWSNFEIADMDFFRSNAYRDFFASLDKAGGFYYERVSSRILYRIASLPTNFSGVGRRSCTLSRRSSFPQTNRDPLLPRSWIRSSTLLAMPWKRLGRPVA